MCCDDWQNTKSGTVTETSDIGFSASTNERARLHCQDDINTDTNQWMTIVPTIHSRSQHQTQFKVLIVDRWNQQLTR